MIDKQLLNSYNYDIIQFLFDYITQMSFFGVELNAQLNKLLVQIRLTLAKNNYLPNIRTIYRACAKFDPQNTGRVTPLHFEKALEENGIFFKKFEWQVFQKAFSREGESAVNWLYFLSYLRQPLSLNRTKTLDAIWDVLDSKKAGRIHYTTLSEKFNASQFKEFKLGFKSKDTILQELLGLVNVNPQGFIAYEQFISFYTDLAVNIPSDEVFSRFVSSQWGVEYKPTPVTTLQEVKTALRTIRFKLVQRTEGTHEEFILRKIFNEFDTSKNGKLNAEELAVMLIKLQIPTQQRLLAGIISRISHTQDGQFDFQDFQQFVFYDPYHI